MRSAADLAASSAVLKVAGGAPWGPLATEQARTTWPRQATAARNRFCAVAVFVDYRLNFGWAGTL